MPDETRTDKADYAATMVTALKTALTSGSSVVVSVTIDGNTTTWDRDRAQTELEYWRKQVTRFRRATNSRTSTIRLDGAE